MGETSDGYIAEMLGACGGYIHSIVVVIKNMLALRDQSRDWWCRSLLIPRPLSSLIKTFTCCTVHPPPPIYFLPSHPRQHLKLNCRCGINRAAQQTKFPHLLLLTYFFFKIIDTQREIYRLYSFYFISNNCC